MRIVDGLYANCFVTTLLLLRHFMRGTQSRTGVEAPDAIEPGPHDFLEAELGHGRDRQSNGATSGHAPSAYLNGCIGLFAIARLAGDDARSDSL